MSSSVALIASNAYDFQDTRTAKYGTRIGALNQSIHVISPISGASQSLSQGDTVSFSIDGSSCIETPSFRLTLGKLQVRFNNTELATAVLAENWLLENFGIRPLPLNNLYGMVADQFSYSNIDTSESVSEMVDIKVMTTKGDRLNLISNGGGRLSEFSKCSGNTVSSYLAGNGTAVDTSNTRGFNTSYFANVESVVATAGDTWTATIRMELNEACTGTICNMALHDSPRNLIGVGKWTMNFTLNDPIKSMFATTIEGGARDLTVLPIEEGTVQQMYFKTAALSPLIPVPDSIVWHVPRIERFQAKSISWTPASHSDVLYIPIDQMTQSTVSTKFSVEVDIKTFTPTLVSPEKRYMRIISFSVTPENLSESLGTYSREDLYRLSRSNGYRGSFSCWDASKRKADVADGVGRGSIMVYRPADLSLPPQYTSNAHITFGQRAEVAVSMPPDFVADGATPYMLELRVYQHNDYKLQLDRTVSSDRAYSIRRVSLAVEDILSTAARDDLSFGDTDLSAMRLGGNWFTDMFEAGKRQLSKGWDFLTSEEGRNLVRDIRNTAGLSGVAGDGTVPGKIASALGYGDPMGGATVPMGGMKWTPDAISRHARA